MSYISIRPESITKACKRYYNDRNNTIESLQDKQIDKLMNRRFFAPKTREAAINKLKNSSSMALSKFDLYELYDIGNCYKVDELNDLASIAIKNNESINLSSEHAAILKNYLT